MSSLIIFDFDGVVADSEYVANKVLAEMITELGFPTSLEDSYNQYMGKTFAGVISQVRSDIGKPLPTDFPDDFQSRLMARFRAELKAIDGVRDYIAAFSHIPICIASNSTLDRLTVCLDVLDLAARFGPRVYSASNMARGKPDPAVFLHAARQMDVEPANCIVIEDSVTGVQAGVSAGMTVIGLLAGSHIQAGHDGRLIDAGVHHIAPCYTDVQSMTRDILSGMRP